VPAASGAASHCHCLSLPLPLLLPCPLFMCVSVHCPVMLTCLLLAVCRSPRERCRLLLLHWLAVADVSYTAVVEQLPQELQVRGELKQGQGRNPTTTHNVSIAEKEPQPGPQPYAVILQSPHSPHSISSHSLLLLKSCWLSWQPSNTLLVFTHYCLSFLSPFLFHPCVVSHSLFPHSE
jgi:hypothetical protein